MTTTQQDTETHSSGIAACQSPLSGPLSAVVSQAKQIEQKPPSSAPQSQAVTLMSDPAGRKELATILFQCFQALKLYGKEPEALEAVVAMHQMVLADYPFGKIRDAFAFYLRTNTELPAPADIANIIERGNKPPFDKAVYVAICKTEPYLRGDEAWRYIREYEHFQMTGRHISVDHPNPARGRNVTVF